MVYLVVVLAVVALAAAGLIVIVRKGASSARARIDARLAELGPVRAGKANFYGNESRGATQMRGLGTLALTADELVFLQLVPSFELCIPRSAITGTSVATSFLGKTQGRDLLVVEWTDAGADPATDRAAFDVADLDGWRAALG